MKAILAVVAVLVIVVVGYLLWYRSAIQEAATGPAKEIVSENIEKKGDVWHVTFVSKFDAPIDRVYEAYSQPERLKEFAPDNILKSDLVKSEGNVKLVDLVARLDILPPGFKVQNPRLEFTYFPAEKRVLAKSIDFQLADIVSEAKLTPTPDGKTLMTVTQTNKAKAATIVDTLQRGAIRENHIIIVRAVNRALGLSPQGDAKKAS
jgi:hypothetical protein